jgi:hypothetical protein
MEFKASFNGGKPKFTASHKKKSCMFHGYAVIAIGNDFPKGHKEIIDLRLYGIKSSGNWSACLWINSKGLLGSGNATGGGYDRKAAATELAINNAGITLNQPIGGTSQIPDVLLAIAFEMGYSECMVVEQYQ